MNSTKVSFDIPKSLLEPGIFLVIAAFAGSNRFIQYFPEATKGGLILTGGAAGAACVIHDYMYNGKDFDVSKKLIAIAIGSFISLGLAQPLKGRVSLNVSDTLKISLVGGFIVLLKNVYEYSPSSLATNVGKGNNKNLAIKIPKGPSGCLDYRSNPPKKKQINLIDNVYQVMHDNNHPLLMTKADFLTLKSICHSGAFGGLHRPLENSELPLYGLEGEYMILWKIPADLKKVDNFIRDSSVEYEESNVGKYYAVPDYIPSALPGAAKEPLISSALSDKAKEILLSFKTLYGTKIRTDFSDGVTPSTHHLTSFSSDVLVSGISSSFFFRSYQDPKSGELENVKNFLDKLAKKGFGAYLCNGAHHLVVIGTYKDKQITPQELADLFDGDDKLRNDFAEALHEVAVPIAYDTQNMKERVNPWMNAFIKRFKTVAE